MTPEQKVKIELYKWRTWMNGWRRGIGCAFSPTGKRHTEEWKVSRLTLNHTDKVIERLLRIGKESTENPPVKKRKKRKK